MNYQKKTVNIDGWEKYQCDTEGIIYGQNGRPLKPNVNKKGYKYVIFCKNGKTKTLMVHRIIALTFVENPMNLPMVNHKDGNKLNNKAENFEWTTNKDNIIHARDKLGVNFGESNKRAIQGFDKKTGELKYEFDSLSEASRYFVKTGKDYKHIKSTISSTIKGRKKSYKNCVWKYKTE